MNRRLAKTSLEIEINKYLASYLIDLISQAASIDKSLLMSKSRKRHLTDIKHIIRVVILDQTRLSKEAIGLLTNCDHSTVINSENVFNNLYPNDKQFSLYVNMIFDYLKTKNIIIGKKDFINKLMKKEKLLLNLLHNPNKTEMIFSELTKINNQLGI